MDYQTNANIKLSNIGIRASAPRKAIYSFIAQGKTHPTADDVYKALSPSNPTLSKTTVYNTLKLLSKKGLLSVVRIENEELRYDADTSNHAHFKCTKCGKIFDLFCKDMDLLVENCRNALPQGFRAQEIRAGIWGTCADCSLEI